MKETLSLYVLGTVGFAVTALLHILVSSITGSASLAVWTPIYTVWMVFMSIGFALLMRRTKSKA